LTTVVCGNVDATTAPLLAGPVQTHGATIRGVKSPVREGPASAGTPRAGPEGPRTLKNSDLSPMGYQPTPGTVGRKRQRRGWSRGRWRQIYKHVRIL